MPFAAVTESSTETIVAAHIAEMPPCKAGQSVDQFNRQYGRDPIDKPDSNEPTFGISPRALDAGKTALNRAVLYHKGGAHDLKDTIGKRSGVSASQIVIGNGSDGNQLYQTVPASTTAGRALALELQSLGFEPTPRDSNSLFFELPTTGREAAEWLRSEGIRAKPWLKNEYETFLQISVGKRDDDQALHEAIKKLDMIAGRAC
ncbi:MAG: hypothetical protein AAF590_11685 [Pseudomonadota bacterium]